MIYIQNTCFKLKILLSFLLIFTLYPCLYSDSSFGEKLTFKKVKYIKVKISNGKVFIKQNKEKKLTEISHLLKAFDKAHCKYLIEKNQQDILIIHNEKKSDSFQDCEMDLTIVTVENVEIEIENESGETELFGDYEKVKIKHREGNVSVSGKIEFAHVESKHGDIKINNSQIYNLYMKSQTGSINAFGNFKKVRSSNKLGDTNIQGVDGDCKADSRSGELKIFGHIEKLIAKSQNGDIHASGLTKDSTLSSRTGHIKAYYKLAPNKGSLIANSKTGEISIHLPSHAEFRLLSQKKDLKSLEFEKTNPKHNFHIKAQSRHGEIHIKKRQETSL